MKVLAPTNENLARAAETLRSGGVVVIPTETVYGLACDATNVEAVRRVFEIKGRPSSNPLIVHVSGEAQATTAAREWPEAASALVRAFWPGPLTLVVPRSENIPPEVAAGLDTVALRMPSHPVARAIIGLAGFPIAAPSANRFMQLSPTRVEHIDPELAAQADLVVDGGPCEVGIESTVVDLSSDPPELLRPGGVQREEIEGVLGLRLSMPDDGGPKRSPGMHRRHYAPRAKLILVERLESGQAGLAFGTPSGPDQVQMPTEPRTYAAKLFEALHRLDAAGPAIIYVEAPPEDPAWEAVWDRLYRASAE